MTLQKYIAHYISMPDALYYLLISLGVVIIIHFILMIASSVRTNQIVKAARKEETVREAGNIFTNCYLDYTERYYELIFSASSILLFIGIYFWIDFDYFGLFSTFKDVWTKYDDFLLLGFIIISIVLNTILDHLFVPLKHVEKDEIGTLRMTGMVYMLIIFAYIKFIYEDNNYDQIVIYFLTLVIGRFVYFDASFKDFLHSMRKLIDTMPILLLVLLSTALLSWFGFKTEYLLRSNGVVISLFIAHFFLILEIFVISKTRLMMRIWRKRCYSLRRENKS